MLKIMLVIRIILNIIYIVVWFASHVLGPINKHMFIEFLGHIFSLCRVWSQA